MSLRWLEDYVRVDVAVESLVERLDLSGTKVEAVHRPEASIKGVVVAEVLEIREHPNAENLTLVDVRLDDTSTQRVVCGARNFTVGARVPLATVGARLPGLTITERRIRGEASRGMLCSAAELGVSEDHSGILVLPPDAPLGADALSVLGLDDTVIELEITPNRPDCMSMVGVAREVAALLGNELRLPGEDVSAGDDVAPEVVVDIQDVQGCPRYVAQGIAGVVVGPSPLWLSTRLLAAGVRPISNVVDVTNYVMLELGQPLHAFDATKIAERTIVVRRARAGEKLVTLDGAERTMHPDDLVIADPHKALALAGVMGGADSEVSEATAQVILESAYFAPASVAFTQRRHLLRTEASARFERGTDPNGAAVAARRAARLTAEVVPGALVGDPVDAYPAPLEPVRLTLRPQRTDALLGVALPGPEQATRLRSIALEVIEEDDRLVVEAPTFRPDLRREVDLVEEVARLAGYERLPSTVPSGPAGGLDRSQAAERRLRWTLAGFGLQEAWTPSFGSSAELDALGLADDHGARAMVELANPTSDEFPALRTTLLPGLIRSAARNLAHRAGGVALFEIAPVYRPADDGLPHEPLMLGAIFCGERRRTSWNGAGSSWDFFAAKGVLEATWAAMALSQPGLEPVGEMPWHPTRAARLSLEGAPIGWLGDLHPDVCERFEVAAGAVALELEVEPVFSALPERLQAQEVPRFPGVYIDVALVVDDGVAAQVVEDAIRAAGAPDLSSVRLFDVYRGAQVGAGRKSLAYALEVRSPDKTLTDDEALAVRDRIVEAVAQRTGAELRA
ncbi:MAG: phenylalanine--tRNA ligase subunit beta [Actinomycetota bacterium]